MQSSTFSEHTHGVFAHSIQARSLLADNYLVIRGGRTRATKTVLTLQEIKPKLISVQ